MSVSSAPSANRRARRTSFRPQTEVLEDRTLLSFGTPTSFAVGVNPVDVVAGDFNRDGNLDLAVANYGDGTVSVLLGNGSGAMTPASGSPITGFSDPSALATGDFNRDGKPDLAVAIVNGAKLSVLLGNGAGSFSPAAGSPFAIGAPPDNVTVGDFNNDGKLDLATSNGTFNDVSVFMGNGVGGFTAAAGSPYSVDDRPTDLTTADFNGDGNLDIVTANADPNSNNVSILLGDGSGGFTTASGSPIAVGSSPHAVVTGDFNRDGRADIAVANELSDTVTVLTGNGIGGFSSARGSPFAVQNSPSSLTVGDFNGDGKPDLVVTNVLSASLSLLYGNGGSLLVSPLFQNAITIGAGFDPVAVASADFFRDGRLDLAVTSYAEAAVRLIVNQSSSETRLSSAPNPALVGQTITFTATVVAPGPTVSTPTGSVDLRDGATRLDSATLSGGVATFTFSSLAAGSHAITAAYSGDNIYMPSTSVSLFQTVNNPVPTITGFDTTSASEGHAELTLTLTGTNFVNGATVQGNGVAWATTFVDATHLQATIPAVSLAEEAALTITVLNPGLGGGLSNSQTFAVTDAPLTGAGRNVVAAEGELFSSVIATFMDADPGGRASDFSASIAWGDGATSAGAITANGNGGFDVTGAHVYAQEGAYTVAIAIFDGGGSTASLIAVATIADAPLSAGGTRFQAVEAASSGSVLIAAFGDSSDPEGISDYTATITWGDGTPDSAGTITRVGSVFDVTASHVYANAGSFNVSVLIQDDGDAAVTASTTALVADAALTGNAVALNVAQGLLASDVAVATFTDAGGPDPLSTYAATIDWGDGTMPSAGTITLAGAVFTVSGTHVFSAPGHFSPTVTVSDTGGSVVTLSSPVPNAVIGDANERFVSQAYRDVLQRPVDEAGLAFWAGLLDLKAITRTQVAQTLVGSLEYRVLQIQPLYQNFLHRTIDAGGLKFWSDSLAVGLPLEGIKSFIFGSDEYFKLHGSDNDSYLKAAYQDLFGRAIDSGGEQFWLAQMQHGLTRVNLANAFVRFPEAEDTLVKGYFAQYLHHPPDAAGLAAFSTALQKGTLRDEDVVKALVATDEYFARL